MRPPSDKVPFLLRILHFHNGKSPGGWSSALSEQCPDSTTLDGHELLDPWGFVFPAHALTLDNVLALILYQAKIILQVLVCLL